MGGYRGMNGYWNEYGIIWKESSCTQVYNWEKDART